MPNSDFPGLWMNVEDVFHIRGRGTIITGLLQGHGQISAGDLATCDGQSWKVDGIEQFRQQLPTAQAGLRVGVLLRSAPPADALRGRLVQFGPKSGAQPAAGQIFGPGTPVTPKKKRRFL